uniref:Thiamine-triphosphatase n=1 Tax=Varanus komodoensis TaxID=61221 RepID=A0A8D2LI88_VARKO
MDAAAAGKEPASGLIEVEQKFLSGPDTAEKLVALGATLDGILTFRDRYYDRADYRLTLADHWLREREGAGWELKCPPPSTASVSGPTTTHYLEVTSPRETVARICALLGVDPALAWHDDVAAAVEELGLQEFASFVTQRSKYRLGDLNVVLDEMDFGYAVGEVEAMVRQEEVPAALEQIRKLGVHLGFDETTRFPGKMSAYLYKFKPAQYNALLQRGRVADGTNREGART